MSYSTSFATTRSFRHHSFYLAAPRRVRQPVVSRAVRTLVVVVVVAAARALEIPPRAASRRVRLLRRFVIVVASSSSAAAARRDAVQSPEILRDLRRPVRVPPLQLRLRPRLPRRRRRRPEGRSIRANVGVELKGVRSGVERRRWRGLKPGGGRRDTTGKVLKKRRSPRRRGRMGTSV